MKTEKILIPKDELVAIFNMGRNAVFPNLNAEQVASWILGFKKIVETPAHQEKEEKKKNTAKTNGKS